MINYLKSNFNKYEKNIIQNNLYKHKLEEIEGFYYRLDQNDLEILHPNILAVYMYDKFFKDQEVVMCAIIDFIYYLGENEIDFNELSPFKSIVIAYSLYNYNLTLASCKRSLWLNNELLDGLLEVTDNLEQVIMYILEFQKRIVDEKNTNKFNVEVLSDSEIYNLVSDYIMELNGQRRIK